MTGKHVDCGSLSVLHMGYATAVDRATKFERYSSLVFPSHDIFVLDGDFLFFCGTATRPAGSQVLGCGICEFQFAVCLSTGYQYTGKGFARTRPIPGL